MYILEILTGYIALPYKCAHDLARISSNSEVIHALVEIVQMGGRSHAEKLYASWSFRNARHTVSFTILNQPQHLCPT
jgi:hypothetical protein